jgi:hypothetical protein
MCKKWHVETPGKCCYGEKCQFIHDENKIRGFTGFTTSFNYLVSMPIMRYNKKLQATVAEQPVVPNVVI